MEICQHCGMYMKPFFSPLTDAGPREASCEFCGRTIAREKDGKWEKLDAVSTKKPN